MVIPTQTRVRQKSANSTEWEAEIGVYKTAISAVDYQVPDLPYEQPALQELK